MSDDDAKVIESLGILALALWRDDWDDATRTAKNAIALIERLAARNASLKDDVATARGRGDQLWARVQVRNDIIAERVLRWRKYPVGNAGQEAYAPSRERAAAMLLGDDLSRFVDEAVEGLLRDAGPTSTRSEAG